VRIAPCSGSPQFAQGRMANSPPNMLTPFVLEAAQFLEAARSSAATL
jgi:hypothetical protein